MTGCRLFPRLLFLSVVLAASPVAAQDVEFFPEQPPTAPHRAAHPHAPELRVPVDSIYYDDGDYFIDFTIGFEDSDEIYAAVRFSADVAFDLTHVRFWGQADGGETARDVLVEVYDGAGADPSGSALLHAQEYMDLLSPDGRMHYVDLGTTLTFDAGEAFFIVVRFEQTPGPPGAVGGDLGPGTDDYEGRSFFSRNGLNWIQLDDIDEDGFGEVIVIRAVTDDGEPPSVCDSDITLSTQAEVDAFDCTEVGGNLSISDGFVNDDITDLSPLAGLESVGGALIISDNDLLTSLTGLENLASVGGALSVSRNESLSSLAGLKNLVSVAGLSFSNNSSLSSFAGLEGLKSAGGISVILNAALTSFVGLEEITSLTGDLTVIENASLLTLEGLSSLGTIGGDLELNSNASLTSIDALAGVTSIGGGIGIFDNPMLESLTALASLTEIGPMTIRGNSALESLAGLEGLTVIGGVLLVAENASLMSLEGLNNLTTIESALGIGFNPSLESLDGLEGITSIGGELLVVENATLSDCACGLAGVISGDPPTFSGVGGMVTFENNDPGGACTSPQVVLDAFADAMCMPVANEPSATAPDRFVLSTPYPNPFTRSTTIAIGVPSLTDVRLAVYDVLGREVAVLIDGSVDARWHEVVFDASGLPSGSYFVRMTAEHESKSVRRVTLVR